MDCWYGRKIASIFSRKKKRTLQIGYPFNARKDEKEESILISNPEANISYASGTLPYSQEAIAASITRAHLSEIIGTDLPAGFIEINCPTLAELRGDTQNQLLESTRDELKRYESLFERTGCKSIGSFAG